MGYPNGNKDATALIDAPLRDNPALYPSKEIMSPLYPLETLPLRRTRAYAQLDQDQDRHLIGLESK